ncbi:MAG: BrnT family toxin [Thiohalocapsa sp.]
MVPQPPGRTPPIVALGSLQGRHKPSRYVDFFDPEHSDDENRFIRVGSSNQQRILLVSYTEREHRARIISAREATKHERQAYEEN